MIEVSVEIKPLSINKCWQGRRFKTTDYKDYEYEMMLILPKQKMVMGEVSVEVDFYVKSTRRIDADNLIKPLFDILTKMRYWEDDRYVYEIRVRKIKSKVEKINIRIKKLATN